MSPISPAAIFARASFSAGKAFTPLGGAAAAGLRSFAAFRRAWAPPFRAFAYTLSLTDARGHSITSTPVSFRVFAKALLMVRRRLSSARVLEHAAAPDVTRQDEHAAGALAAHWVADAGPTCHDAFRMAAGLSSTAARL